MLLHLFQFLIILNKYLQTVLTIIKVALSIQGDHFKLATIRTSQTTQLAVKYK